MTHKCHIHRTLVFRFAFTFTFVWVSIDRFFALNHCSTKIDENHVFVCAFIFGAHAHLFKNLNVYIYKPEIDTNTVFCVHLTVVEYIYIYY